jgi:hypothetical protein
VHLPEANLAIFKKGTYYSGITIFNSLPTDIKVLSEVCKKFKTALKHVLYLYSLCTLDEYFNRYYVTDK